MNGAPVTDHTVLDARVKPRARLPWVAGGLLVIAALAAFFMLRPGAGAPAATTEAPPVAAGAPTGPAAVPPGGASLTVNLIRPTPVLWPETLVANGSITAWQEAVVSAELGGARVAELLVDVGDQVRRGDVLARFDPAAVKAALAQQQAAVAETRARLAETSAAAKRAQRLRETFAISEQDLIKAQTSAEAAQAQVDLALARLESQQLAFDDTRVLAPDDGVISARTAMLGAVAAPGMEMFRMVRQNRLDWRAELTPAQLVRLQVGATGELRLPDGSTVTGTVRQIAPVLDEKTRIGIAYVALDAGAANVRPGMYAAGTIVLGDRAGLALPSSAIVVRDGRESVFVVDAEGRATETRIKVGRRRGNQIEVLEGIDGDDGVVASGAAFLNNGDRVRVVDAPTAASKPGASA